MSVAFCRECDVVLDDDVISTTDPVNGEVNEYCPYCRQPVTYLNEDDPKEDR